jgi:hypothetical protein
MTGIGEPVKPSGLLLASGIKAAGTPGSAAIHAAAILRPVGLDASRVMMRFFLRQ